MTATEELHTVAEVAEALRVNRETLYRAIRRGEIEVVQVGRVLRVPETSLERLRRPPEPRP
jgi:excisionase family DNA binding protein